MVTDRVESDMCGNLTALPLIEALAPVCLVKLKLAVAEKSFGGVLLRACIGPSVPHVGDHISTF